MPYIGKGVRLELQYRKHMTEGELTYVLYKACLDYIKEEGECFATFASVLGSLEACKLELYRKKIGPYEDRKIEENGDVV